MDDFSKFTKTHDDFNNFCPLRELKYTYYTDYTYFDGIPKLCSHFVRANPLMDITEHSTVWPIKIADSHDATVYWQMQYVYNYLLDEKFHEAAQNSQNDYVIHAILAYIAIHWNARDLKKFSVLFPKVYFFTQEILNVFAEDGFVKHTLSGLPITGSAFRIYSRHMRFDHKNEMLTGSENCKSIFSFTLPAEVYSHFDMVYELLMNESWDDAKPILHSFEGRPLLRQFMTPIARRETRPKYVTGMACCGKTTTLTGLLAAGWMVRSRGSLGAFAAKNTSPAYVATLHASLDYALRQCSGFLIGDRGPIDNPLWNIIMPLCSPEHQHNLPLKIVTFFQNCLNELAINYYNEFDVVVFLDQYPSRNRERMMKRDNGGDAHRSRIPFYAVVQFMAYYIFAALFGHKIVTVPYTDDADKTYDVKRAAAISNELLTYYGHPQSPSAEQLKLLESTTAVRKEPFGILLNMRYPKLMAIYK